MRRDDQGLRANYYRFVRVAKAAVGLIFAMGAFTVAVNGGDEKMVLGLALIAGLMFDAPGVTKLAEMVIGALPWMPARPGVSSGGTPREDCPEDKESTDGDPDAAS